MTPFGRELSCRDTAIAGLTIWTLPVYGDERGFFKENWQRAAMTAAGLPDFGPVQQNIAFNGPAGVTRGIHAEPWDKLVSVATGRVFGAWVDLRPGPEFGTVVTAEIDAGAAVFVPRGVGNAYQTLEPATAYSYLVNEHWSADAAYAAVNLTDPQLAIDWPVPLADAVLSEKDRAAPMLADVEPLPPKRILVLGADGQLGRALRAEYAGDERVDFATRADLDIAAEDPQERAWHEYDVILNAAAYTQVDAAETEAGRTEAWATNVTAIATLTKICTEHRITLVHLSSDYVFDGTSASPYREEDPPSPLSVYGQTKAAGDALVATTPRHYLLRTSWVIGEGRNFVRTMADLAARGIDPEVVRDQIGRPTFTADLARAIRRLIESRAPYGTYNVTGSGEPASWYDVSREVFSLVGADPSRITPVTAAEYERRARDRGAPGTHLAPRPAYSVLDLSKIEGAGFIPPDWRESLARYVS